MNDEQMDKTRVSVHRGEDLSHLSRYIDLSLEVQGPTQLKSILHTLHHSLNALSSPLLMQIEMYLLLSRAK